MNCKKCGAPLKPDEEKCPYCGAVVVSPENLPESTQSTRSTGRKSGPLAKMKYVSGTFVIIVSIITLGLYIIYWLCSRKKSLNSLTDNVKVSEGLFWSYIVCLIAGLFVPYLGWVTWILGLFLVFGIRNILREYAYQHIDKATAIALVAPSGVMLFFFGVIYLQFQINKMIKADLLEPEA